MKHLVVLAALAVATPAHAASPSPAPTSAPSAAPSAGATAAPSATPTAAPAVVRLGTAAVLTIRLPLNDLSPAERAGVVQSRIDNVVLNHPYLTWADVKVVREGGAPVIYWGRFPIVSVDAAHATLNRYSSPDILAHAWANSLRQAAKAFFAAKKLPDRALYRDPQGSDFVYRRTAQTVADQAALRNTGYTFSNSDLTFGPGSKAPDQNSYVIFTKTGAPTPPDVVYLGNSEGTFTAYERITENDQP